MKYVKLEDVLKVRLLTLCTCKARDGFLTASRSLCDGCKYREMFAEDIRSLPAVDLAERDRLWREWGEALVDAHDAWLTRNMVPDATDARERLKSAIADLLDIGVDVDDSE